MLNVRPAYESDIPTLQELMEKSGVEVPGIKYDVFTHMVLVAEFNGEVVGFVQFLLGMPYCHLTEMSVHPEWRGYGVGKALLAKAESMLKDGDYKAWVTFTSKDHIAEALTDWGARCTGSGYGFVRSL